MKTLGRSLAAVVLLAAFAVGLAPVAGAEAPPEASSDVPSRLEALMERVAAARPERGEVSASSAVSGIDAAHDGYPQDICYGDIRNYAADYGSGYIALSFTPACYANPNTSPNWNPGITSAIWWIDVTGDLVEDYVVGIVNEGGQGAAVLDVRGADPVAVCLANTPIGSHSVSFDPACIGNPSAAFIQLGFLWDEAPFASSCVCPVDYAPDGGVMTVTAPAPVVPVVPVGDGPAATSAGTGTLNVFARGADDALWTRYFDGANWSGWASLGGRITGTPAAASPATGQVDVFVRGADNALWTRRFDGSAWGPWSSLSGVLSTPPAVASASGGTLDVFAAGQDTALWTRHFDGASWGAWSSLQGRITATPAASSGGPGRIDVFVRGADNALWSRHFNGGWDAWSSHGGSISTAPSATGTQNVGNSVEVFARGGDNALWTTTWPGSAWSSLGGTIASPPAAASPGVDQVVVFARGTDGALWYNQRPSGTWLGWQSLGGTIR